MIGPIAVVPFVLLVVISVIIVRSRHAQRPLELDRSRQGTVLATHRKAVGWRWAGLGLGVVAAYLTAGVGSLGLGLMLAPTVFGLCVIGGVAVGELASIPRREGQRTAALETRTLGDYVPRRLSGLVSASTIGPFLWPSRLGSVCSGLPWHCAPSSCGPGAGRPPSSSSPTTPSGTVRPKPWSPRRG